MESEQELQAGYGAAAPAGDNLCNDYAQGVAEGFAALAEGRGDRVLSNDDVMLSDSGSASLFGNVAVVRRPIDTDASSLHALGRTPAGPLTASPLTAEPDVSGRELRSGCGVSRGAQRWRRRDRPR
jgi:hypothetical protein